MSTVNLTTLIDRVREMTPTGARSSRDDWTDGFIQGQNSMLDDVIEFLESVDFAAQANEDDLHQFAARAKWLRHCSLQGAPVAIPYEINV
jgi:hypothetical protein